MTHWLAKYRDRYGTHTISIKDTGKKLTGSFKGTRKIDDIEDFVAQLSTALKKAKKARKKRRGKKK